MFSSGYPAVLRKSREIQRSVEEAKSHGVDCWDTTDAVRKVSVSGLDLDYVVVGSGF